MIFSHIIFSILFLFLAIISFRAGIAIINAKGGLIPKLHKRQDEKSTGQYHLGQVLIGISFILVSIFFLITSLKIAFDGFKLISLV